jgi:hypothetical protein
MGRFARRYRILDAQDINGRLKLLVTGRLVHIICVLLKPA